MVLYRSYPIHIFLCNQYFLLVNEIFITLHSTGPISIIKNKQTFAAYQPTSLSLFLSKDSSINKESHIAVTHPSLVRALSPVLFVVDRKMGYSKTFLLLGLVFSVVLLISSDVSARELAEAAQTGEFLYFLELNIHAL
jgi:hypothetical protein